MRERLALAGMFGATALRYWTGVFPGVCRELARWRRRAGEIADPVLRGLALEAPGKRGNIEGAAAFAVFVPRSHRNLVLRAVVAFQTAYNYLDLLAEQPGPDPAANARRLHEALLVALGRVRTQSSHPDYYEHQRRLDARRDHYIEQTYFPWIGALHSLLDNLVDVAEDHATGQHNLIGCYASTLEASTRMRLLAECSRRAARELPGDSHGLILRGWRASISPRPKPPFQWRAPWPVL